MSLASLCRKTCTISNLVSTPDGEGGDDESFVAAYANHPCTIQPAKGSTIVEFGRRNMQISHVLYSPKSFDAATGSIVVEGDKTYLVQSVADQADRQTVYAAYLLEKR
jgi:hypothetical protein